MQDYYAAAAERLAEQYESVSFEAVHGDVLPLLPSPPGRVVDVGAGTGRDAAALSRLGYDVVAVEPVRELRAVARRLHPDVPVRWVAGALPGLDGLTGPFDLVWLSAVWMHLTGEERVRGMRRLSQLTAPAGRVVISVRHGPLPDDRVMFDVPAAETAALAERCGLRVRHVGRGPDLWGRDEVHWSVLVVEQETR